MSESSSTFGLLHEKVQRVLWEQQWQSLRDIQEYSIEPILSGETDVLISAPTASGKTEAAFLPILSFCASNPGYGLQTLYISPLKALINDQFDRIGLFCEKLDIPLHEWHGDVSQSHKREVVEKNAGGILLITPESLEALFVNRGHQIQSLFSSLQYIVIDELHSFIGSERGKQLQSLLRRIEISIKRTIPRIGLSATIGDLELAARYMRCEDNFPHVIIRSLSEGQDIKLQLRGYELKDDIAGKALKDNDATLDNVSDLQMDYGDFIEIADHLYATLRGSNNLIFANSRSRTEIFADLLREISDRNYVPNEFFAHHGSLSKEIREDVEQRLKSQELPITAVATSTLELGIDIGNVKSVAQIGCPPSVASFRQRLGRSGRRGEPAVARLYIQEKEISSRINILDSLRVELVQTIAIINLLIKKWYEQPSTTRLHLSTLIQQILSVTCQYGSVTATDLYKVLCSDAPFAHIDKPTFIEILRALGGKEILTQATDGSITLGIRGERIVGHYSFYASFTTPIEYQIYNKGRVLGTLPITMVLAEDICIIFAGRRWRIIHVDPEKRIVEVERARGGRPPVFGGNGGTISREVRQEMFSIYLSSDIAPFLDKEAVKLLQQGREFFKRYELDKRCFYEFGGHTLFFHWDSDLVANTVMLQLKAMEVDVTTEGVALDLDNTNASSLKRLIKEIAENGFEQAVDLASIVKAKTFEKYDHVLNSELLDREYVSRWIDISNAEELVNRLNTNELKPV